MGIRTTINHNGTDYNGEVGTIVRTFLGIEDHGIFTFMLDFDFQGSGQGAGNIALGEKTADLIVGIANIDTGKSLVFTEVFSG